LLQRHRRFIFLARNGVLLHQRFVAGDVLVGSDEVGFRDRQGPAGLGQCGLVRSRVNGVKKLALADEGPLFKVHAFDEALDPRPDFNLGGAARFSDGFHVDRHVFLKDGGDLHFGGRRGRRGLLLASGEAEGHSDEDQQAKLAH
jgi:hypothetical protein